MSAEQLLHALSRVTFVIIFFVVLVQAIRRPRRVKIDIALFFGVVALAVGAQGLAAVLGPAAAEVLATASASLAVALPYLLLRLFDDFAGVPRPVMRAAEVGLVLLVGGFMLVGSPRPVALTLFAVLYFFSLATYASVSFLREAGRASGVTGRRMRAVAAGSLFLGLAALAGGLRAAAPALEDTWSILGRVFALVSGSAYFLGFAPPSFLRRAWQEPELRAFLGRAARLPRLPDTSSILLELERGAAAALGAPQASIGLWDDSVGALRFTLKDPSFDPPPSTRPFINDKGSMELPTGQMLAGRAFAEQRPLFSADAVRDDPAYADAYRTYGSTAVLAAPITAGQKRLGVLAVYAARAPIFAEDDLALVQLLAGQAAVVLESRALIDEAARVRGQEEATRLKDDFLSAAAHDLRTPLTTLIGQAQLLERRALRDRQAPADLAGIRRLVTEARRLNGLVHELLDASRAEQGQLLGPREPVDLAQIAQEVCDRQRTQQHRCLVEVDEPVVGEYDAMRIVQLLNNLIENAIKYSPDGGEVRVQVWREGDQGRLSVADSGIGVAAPDLGHLFDRFQRGTNVDDRRFAGMGLGLYICRAIAEQHGGRIWAESPGPGRGSTFHVALPLAVRPRVPAGGSPRD